MTKVRQILEQSGTPIEVTQARLTEKPVAVIYNPTSGKKLNIRERIEAKLSEHGIEVRFYET